MSGAHITIQLDDAALKRERPVPGTVYLIRKSAWPAQFRGPVPEFRAQFRGQFT